MHPNDDNQWLFWCHLAHGGHCWIHSFTQSHSPSQAYYVVQ
jgi:hypothetical protein